MPGCLVADSDYLVGVRSMVEAHIAVLPPAMPASSDCSPRCIGHGRHLAAPPLSRQAGARRIRLGQSRLQAISREEYSCPPPR
jgi:hypothetical protein